MHEFLVNQRRCRDCGAEPLQPHDRACSVPERLARGLRGWCLVDARGASRREAQLLVALEAADLRALQRWIAAGRPL